MDWMYCCHICLSPISYAPIISWKLSDRPRGREGNRKGSTAAIVNYRYTCGSRSHVSEWYCQYKCKRVWPLLQTWIMGKILEANNLNNSNQLDKSGLIMHHYHNQRECLMLMNFSKFSSYPFSLQHFNVST